MTESVLRIKDNTATSGPIPAPPIEYKFKEFEQIMNAFNTYTDYTTTIDANGNETITGHGVVSTTEGSNIEERIAQLYSDKYRTYNTVFLGYRSYNSLEELKNVPADTLTDNQKINSQFVVKTNNGQTITLFNTLRFHNRPIYCGVNVLYDPTVSEAFMSIANQPTDTYFASPWDPSYENSKYNGTANDSIDCRDLCFNKSFLEDLQSKANDESELVMAFIRKGFDVGIGEVNAGNLTGDTVIPPLYGRVFENRWKDKMVAYSPVILQSMVSREIPVVANGDIVQQVSEVPNNNCYFTCPSIDDNGKKTEAIVDTAAITNPSIIYVGENINGYSLFSFINVPVCSWEYFKSKSSGLGLDSANNPTKAVKRLEDTQCCGPFMRVKAKDYYTSETNEVLRSYATIKLVYKDRAIDMYQFSPVTVDNKVVWGAPEGKLSENLKAAAKLVYEDKGNSAPKIRFLKFSSEANENRDALYENAYVRGDQTNPSEITAMFDEVHLPDRFAFYMCDDAPTTVYIAQFPCMPLTGAEPMTDDYITQWVPLYRKTDDDASSTEKTWYINKHDILVKRSNNDTKFYNVNRQKASLVTYPAKGSTEGAGYIYTCNGVVYSGPRYEEVTEDKLDENKTKLKDDQSVPLYLFIDDMYVEMVDGGDYSKYDKEKRWRKAKFIPDSIQGIALSEPTDDNIYISGPIDIAQYNKLTFMDLPSTSNIARTSRDAYKEFIKQGCVYDSRESNDPRVYVRDTVNFVFDGDAPEAIDPLTEKQAVEEVEHEPEWKKTVKIVITCVIAVVILALLIIIGVKIRNAFKGNINGFTCPGYARRFA